MTKKFWMLIALGLVLGGLSLYLNRDWFAKDTIQIFSRSRSSRVPFFRRKGPDSSPINPLIFTFDRKVKLTSLKVIPVSSIQTNSFPHPIWHLVSESNSVPIKTFTYGMRIQGMHPEVKGLEPEPLEPGVKYRMFVEANSQKLEHDFVPEARTP
jgi:hypothetical protein